MLSITLVTSNVQAAVIHLRCPDGSQMQNGSSCAPDAGCRRIGVFIQVDGTRIYSKISDEGSVEIDTIFLNKTVKVESGDNFFGPRYCPNYNSGVFFSTFTLQNTQTINMEYRSRLWPLLKQLSNLL